MRGSWATPSRRQTAARCTWAQSACRDEPRLPARPLQYGPATISTPKPQVLWPNPHAEYVQRALKYQGPSSSGAQQYPRAVAVASSMNVLCEIQTTLLKLPLELETLQ